MNVVTDWIGVGRNNIVKPIDILYIFVHNYISIKDNKLLVVIQIVTYLMQIAL